MDTTGKIKPHSQIKLGILRRYLPSLIDIVQGMTAEFQVLDAFCGKGEDDDGQAGSAKIILDVLNEKSIKYPSIKFSGLFNDKDKSNIDEIIKLFNSQFDDSRFTFSTNNQDAENFLAQIKGDQNKKQFKFLFYDPFNYGPTKKAIFNKFLEENYAEALIFIPFSHVFRFIKAVKEGKYTQDHVLVKFLMEIFGNKYLEVENESDNHFLKSLETQFSAKNRLCNSVMIQEKNNKYALLFLTRNQKGQEVFLSSCYSKDSNDNFRTFPIYDCDTNILTLKIIENENKLQLNLFNELDTKGIDDKFEIDNELFFKDLKNKKISNDYLYNFLVSKNILPSHVKKLVMKLIKEEKVLVQDNKGVPIKYKPNMGLHINHKQDKVIYFNFK